MFDNGIPTYAHHQLHYPHQRAGLGAPVYGAPVDNDMPEEHRQMLEDKETEAAIMASLQEDVSMGYIISLSVAAGFLLGLVFPYVVKEIDKRL